MKNFFTTLTLLLLVASSALASNYFTFGVNDTLRVRPSLLGGSVDVPVRAHFDGRLDYWHLKFSFSDSLSCNPYAIYRGNGMDVPYFNSSGTEMVYEAQLNSYSDVDTLFTYSMITETGYWDYDNSGHYAPYGTVKWEAGDYNCMFTIRLTLKSSLPNDSVVIRGDMSSGNDARNGTVGYVYFIKTIKVVVGYERGDVNGDGIVSALDLTALNDYLLTYSGLDQYQLEAADMNGDGNVTVMDFSLLIDYLLTNGQNLFLPEEPA